MRVIPCSLRKQPRYPQGPQPLPSLAFDSCWEGCGLVDNALLLKIEHFKLFQCQLRILMTQIMIKYFDEGGVPI